MTLKEGYAVSRTRENALFNMLASFTVAFGITRGITWTIREKGGFGPIKDVVVGDFQLDVDLQSTARDYDHRSLCLFFGYRDPAHMYYVHLGQVTDKNSNGVFLVDGRDRVKIHSPDVSGTKVVA